MKVCRSGTGPTARAPPGRGDRRARHTAGQGRAGRTLAGEAGEVEGVDDAEVQLLHEAAQGLLAVPPGDLHQRVRDLRERLYEAHFAIEVLAVPTHAHT